MGSVNIEDAIKSGRTFLNTLDTYLQDCWRQTTCDDLYGIFDSFRVHMRTRRGGIAGIHGLSEYLLIRFLSYQLGGDFAPPDLSSGDLDPTRSHPLTSSTRGLILTQGMNATGPNGKSRPDLGVWRGATLQTATLMAAAEIKNWPSDRAAIKADIERLSALANPDFRGVFILLPALSKSQAWLDELACGKKQYPSWFDFVVLEDCKKLLHEELKEKLALDRFPGSAG